MKAQIANNEKVTALILAGGAGRRVGGQDKGQLLWGAKPLVEHVLARLLGQSQQTIISCNRNVEFYTQYAPCIASDLRKDYQGPLAGIEAALEHLDTPRVLIVPCDTPLLPDDLCSRLTEALNTDGSNQTDIVYAHDGLRPQYLCALIRRECILSLSPFLDSGGRAVKSWYATQHARSVDFSDQASAFHNVNALL